MGTRWTLGHEWQTSGSEGLTPDQDLLRRDAGWLALLTGGHLLSGMSVHEAQTRGSGGNGVLLDYICHIMKPLLISLVLFLSIKTSAQECYDLSDQSNWISVVCYEQGILLMKMQGVVYQFCGVDRIVFDGLLRARSPGMYYDQVIRGRYGCQQQQSNDVYWTDPRGVPMYVPR